MRIQKKGKKDQIINKIKKAKTDPMPMPSSINELDNRPEAKNLIGIYSSLNETTLEKSLKEFQGKNFSEFKEKLAEIVVDKISPISGKIRELLNDKKYLDQILLDGSDKASNIASEKVKKIHELIGF